MIAETRKISKMKSFEECSDNQRTVNGPLQQQTTDPEAENNQSFESTFNPFSNAFIMPVQEPQMKTSEDHIASLEAKLKKIKGQVKGEPSGRDLLKSLCEVRQDSVRHMPTEYSEAYIEESVVDEDSPLAQLQRKLHPERQAVNADELLYLVDNDMLQKTVVEISDS